MSQPVVVPREEHSISRKQIDPDALRVLYRLHGEHFIAYLVGGSVRDLLLGRRPKDFDIGTSAHPYQVKRLFRNCWIIGRRFRLAHVRFGPKTIEVATFRRKLSAEELAAADVHADVDAAVDQTAGHVRLLHRDNTFGTPEEDAFRRDFTVNSLFYDIASRSIIDYTGGLDDLKARVIRCIGDPMERFQEDPVRMLRAVAMAARLDFAIDLPIESAITARRAAIANSAPARLMDELYKLLRAGASQTSLPNARRAAVARAYRAQGADNVRRRAMAIARGPRRLQESLRKDPGLADESCFARIAHRPAGSCALHRSDAVPGGRHAASRTGAKSRDPAAGATRRRAPPPDSRAAASPDGRERVPSRTAGAHASRSLSGSLNVAGNPWAHTGSARTLAGVH